MKRFLIIVAAILVILVAAVVALPFVVPKSAMVDFVVAKMEEATGRKVTVGGEPEFSVFPDVTLSINQVSLSNFEGGSTENMAEIRSADIKVDLMAALSGEVVVRRFVLVEPVIVIEKNAEGRFNFDFGGATAAAGDGEKLERSGESGGGDLVLSLDDFRMENATVVYIDAQTGERHDISGLNTTMSLPSMSGPFDMTADAEWRGRRVNIVAHVDDPSAITAGRQTAINTEVSSDDLFSIAFNGAATAGAAPEAAGRGAVSVANVAELLAWADIALGPDVRLPGTLSLEGDMTASPTRLAIAEAAILFDKNRIEGSIAAELSGQRPAVTAELTAGDLDFRAYLPEGGGATAPGGDGAAPAGSADWSDDPIDLSALGAADVDLSLKASSITTGMLDVGATDIAVTGRGNGAEVTLRQLALYEGNATGSAKIDLRGAEPGMSVKLELAGVQARPALQQFADFGDFLGTVNADFDLTTRGNTERKLVSALNGAGRITVTDGAIIGYNLAAAVRNVSTGGLDMTYDKSEKTDFAELSGSFTAKNGLIHNPDLAMNAPLLRVTGSGDIALPPRTIDYRAVPKVVASLTGQGGGDDRGISVPILIRGSWDDPSVQPDMEGVVRGVLESPVDAAKGVADTVKNVGEGGAGAVKGVLDSVTGNNSGSEKGDDPVSGATKKLKGLFGD
ncbi:AsmA family protein [Minwuia thermotolerans]|uniref:AsmA domain-containing protein n=1 Tax=Minwuia thermotolerans TaxID=2056226 RepID=A0A2M9FVR1_9PROT|nr:AsmA family protein [Minwuia thermotolerans]PJK27558.1 hypothetical protein CVT23_21845 [Minwuia thermotolerans]